MYIAQRNIFLIGIREISNDLPIDELTLLFGNTILNDEKNIYTMVDQCLTYVYSFVLQSMKPRVVFIRISTVIVR